jgi:hypothetical protein
MLKYCAANRNRRFSALPNVGPYIYIYTTLKFLALQGAPSVHDISRLRVKYTYSYVCSVLGIVSSSCSVYCLCVKVYCTAASGRQPIVVNIRTHTYSIDY